MHDPVSRAAIDVWVAPLDVPAPLLDRLADALSDEERRRAGRFRSPHDARRFSAARGWLRHILAAELDVEPAAVPVSQGPGKPGVAGGTALRFNVSHGGELALIAVAEREIGVDVEPLDPAGRWADVVDVACGRREAAALRRLPAEEQPVAFLRAWTAKEAYLKATGTGLAMAPDRVDVGQPRAGVAVPVHVAIDNGPARWHVVSLEPRDGYVGAVAAERGDWAVRLRQAGELAGANLR